MAETAMYKDLVDDAGKVHMTVYSTTGQPKSTAEFEAALQQHFNGQKVEGYTFLEPGMLSNMRKGFEAVSQPVQSALETAGGALGRGAGNIVPLDMLTKLGLISPEHAAQIGPAAQQAGAGVGRALGSTVATPEAAMQTLGQVGALAATGGMSFPMQVAGTGLGALLGRQTGSWLTGGEESVARSMAEAGIAAGMQLGHGVLMSVFGRGMSKVAQEKVQSQLQDLLKRELGPMLQDPAALNRYLSTKGGLEKVTQIGIAGIRDDMDTFALQMLSAVNQRLPHSLPRHEAATLRKMMGDLHTASSTFLDSVGNKRAEAVAAKKMNDLIQGIREQAVAAMKGIVTDPKKQNVAGVHVLTSIDEALTRYEGYLKELRGPAEVLGALKRAGAKEGFNAQAFQQEVRSYFQAKPGSAMEAAGQIAGRGADISKGIDHYMIPSIRVPFSRYHTPAMGKRYVGSVQSPLPAIGSTLTGRAAIESFTRGEE